MGLSTWLPAWRIQLSSLKTWMRRMVSRCPIAPTPTLEKSPSPGQKDEVQKENPSSERASENLASKPASATDGYEEKSLPSPVPQEPSWNVKDLDQVASATPYLVISLCADVTPLRCPSSHRSLVVLPGDVSP